MKSREVEKLPEAKREVRSDRSRRNEVRASGEF